MATLKNHLSPIVLAALLAILIIYGASDVLLTAMPVVAWSLAGLGTLAALIALLVFGLLKHEEFLTRRVELKSARTVAQAQAAQALNEADQSNVKVIIAGQNEQVIVRDKDAASNYRQLHLNPRPVVNGHFEAPTAQQIQIYRDYRGNLPKNEVILDQFPDPQTLLTDGHDWLRDTLMNSYHVHFCGATRSGKTTLANKHLELIMAANPGAECILINPKDVADKAPFIIPATYSGVDQALEGLYRFNYLLNKRNTPGANRDQLLVMVIDEWDWIKTVHGNEAIGALMNLVKVGAELNIKVLLIGQSPLTGDTGLSQSFYYNMTRVAIWAEGQRLLHNYPLARKYKVPLLARYEQLKAQAAQHKATTGQDLRYCVVIPQAGNPTVRVIPNLAQASPGITIIDNPAQAGPEPEPPAAEKKIFIAWKQVWDNYERSGKKPAFKPSWNKVYHVVNNTENNVPQREIEAYKALFERWNVQHKL